MTSCARFNLSGEQVYPLGGMKVPPPDAPGAMLEYSAVELFLDAACRVNPGYTPDSLKGVARICRLVEGMPLSLLLASTWDSDHSTQEISEQISHSLDFLTVEWAGLPERQRSFRATFEYSWTMLSYHEQQVLMSFSVFRNPFTLQAAHDVVDASPQVIRALVGKSLLGLMDEGQ